MAAHGAAAKKPFKAQLFSRWGVNACMVSKGGKRWHWYAMAAKTQLHDVPLYWDGDVASLSRRFPGVGGRVGSISTEVVPLTVLDSAYRGTLVLQSLYPFFLQLYK